MGRIVCRFSCGAPSAVATKLTLAANSGDEVVVTYSDPGAEHPDNARFLKDCEVWFGREVVILRSERYSSPLDVWRGERFIRSKAGAPCTGLLKRAPSYDFAEPGDVLVLGYTAEETGRAAKFREANFEQPILTPLIDRGLTRADCLAMIERAGIRIPAMYELGFRNNNCIGCCKGGMGYWNKIREHFPEVFEETAALQRELGRGAAFFDGGRGKPRIMLDELKPTQGRYSSEPDIECSLLCHDAEDEYS